jgi:Transglutaminase-like superfamily
VFKLAQVRLSLSWRGFERTLARYELIEAAPVHARAANAVELTLFKSRAADLRRATRVVPGAYCLARAIALSHWARRAGLQCEFCMGVDRANSAVAAHAWTRMSEHVIDDDAQFVARFRVILRR